MLSAYRIREHVDHLLDLSFTARIGTLLVGSVRQLPICVGDTPALLLGPLTVEPPFRSRGVGRALLDRALEGCESAGAIGWCCWSATRPITAASASRPFRRDGRRMPGPVDYNRLLVAELVDGAFTDVSGAIRPDWSFAR